MKSLFIIPARGGSKGVPDKNIRSLSGKPLIAYTIDAAKLVAGPEDIICVSTDSEKIKNVAEAYNLSVPFLRPPELSDDQSGTYEVILHAIDFYRNQGIEFDIVILLQPTSPLRSAKQIREAINQYSQDLDMIVSVKETKSNPYFVLFEEDHEGWLHKSKESDYVTRQECPHVWEYNGAIYVINAESLIKAPIYKFKKVKKYLMDQRSSVDIDTELDFLLAEQILKLLP